MSLIRKRIRAVHSFAGVTNVEVWEEESGETVLDLYFFRTEARSPRYTKKVPELANCV